MSYYYYYWAILLCQEIPWCWWQQSRVHDGRKGIHGQQKVAAGSGIPSSIGVPQTYYHILINKQTYIWWSHFFCGRWTTASMGNRSSPTTSSKSNRKQYWWIYILFWAVLFLLMLKYHFPSHCQQTTFSNDFGNILYSLRLSRALLKTFTTPY